MTDDTMNRKYNPGTTPLVGLCAVVAAAVTMGMAVLLPAHLAPMRLPANATGIATIAVPAPSIDTPAPTQIVTLPAIEVTANRLVKSAATPKWHVPAVYRQRS